MSGDTLNDGYTPDRKICPGISYDIRMTDLAPPRRLLGDYYKRGLSWEDFEIRYRSFLQNKSEILKCLCDVGYHTNIVLLCKEDTPDMCHRRILIEEIFKHRPEIVTTVD